MAKRNYVKQTTRAIKDRPYVDNYPPLRDFLREIGARCNIQLPAGDPDDPTSYVEQWTAWSALKGKSVTFQVVVHRDGMGWDIATFADTNEVDETLRVTRERLGL